MASVFDPLITLGRKRLETEDVSRLIKTINAGNDSSAAILGGIFIEDVLREAITGRLVALSTTQESELFKSGGPLSNFDCKIILGRALGLFDSRTKHDLTAIRHIRNTFAHCGTHDLSFSASEVSAVCDSLNWLQAAVPFRETPTTAREKFSFVVRALAINFLILIQNPSRPDAAADDLKGAIARVLDYHASHDK